MKSLQRVKSSTLYHSSGLFDEANGGVASEAAAANARGSGKGGVGKTTLGFLLGLSRPFGMALGSEP
jgi:hypothetical protein